jgi:host factor-I protein
VKKAPPTRNFKTGPAKAGGPPPPRPRGPAPAAREADTRAPSHSKQSPPDSTLRETLYLKSLVANKTPVLVRLRDNKTVEGIVEYYDAAMIRLTRDGEANLFIYKADIKYLEEQA